MEIRDHVYRLRKKMQLKIQYSGCLKTNSPIVLDNEEVNQKQKEELGENGVVFNQRKRGEAKLNYFR